MRYYGLPQQINAKDCDKLSRSITKLLKHRKTGLHDITQRFQSKFFKYVFVHITDNTELMDFTDFSHKIPNDTPVALRCNPHALFCGIPMNSLVAHELTHAFLSKWELKRSHYQQSIYDRAIRKLLRADSETDAYKVANIFYKLDKNEFSAHLGQIAIEVRDIFKDTDHRDIRHNFDHIYDITTGWSYENTLEYMLELSSVKSQSRRNRILRSANTIAKGKFRTWNQYTKWLNTQARKAKKKITSTYMKALHQTIEEKKRLQYN